jgi:hypothetical protein
MGFNLSNGKENIRFSTVSFYKTLGLAKTYGWIPKGTNCPEKMDELENWDGEYYTNLGQYVTSEDAINLAKALERALENIPDLKNPPIYPIKGKRKSRQDFLNSLGSKQTKDSIKTFIAFCKEGKGFYIS